MRISLLVEMAGDALGDRPIVGSKDGGLRVDELLGKARLAAAWARRRNVERIGLIGGNSQVVPITLLAGSIAGLPFVPLNFRLADDRLQAILSRIAPAVVVVDEGVADARRSDRGNRARRTTGVSRRARRPHARAL